MIENIKTFHVVVMHEGFRAAAKTLHLSPGMISRRIEQLELKLGVKLIRRNTRQMSLTPAGERFYNETLSLIEQYDVCVRGIRALTNDISGNLKVGIPHAIKQLYVIPNLHKFSKLYPNIRLDIVTGDHYSNFVSHGFDLAIHYGNLPDSNLYYSILGSWSNSICLSAQYADLHGIPCHPNQLHEHNCLLHYERSPKAWSFLIDGKEVDIKIEPSISVDSYIDLTKMVSDGLGISSIPDFAVRAALRNGTLLSVLDAYKSKALPLYILYANPQPSKEEMAFIEFIRSLNITLK
jgi:LysR family transcriptional regulator for bpeEF and oprC